MAGAFWAGASSRRILERVVVEAELVLLSPARFGSGDAPDLTDMPLLVDETDRRSPLLTGTTLAGALRAHLRARERGFRQPEPAREDKAAITAERESASTRLFGGFRGDDAGEQSSLVVEDALGTDAAREVRAGVAIDPRSRTAAADKLYDGELWAAGTRFPLRLELAIREEDDGDRLRRALATALTGLVDGSITLGARKRRGFGRVTVDRWKVGTYVLTRPDDLLAWVRGVDPASVVADGDVERALGGALPDQRDLLRIVVTGRLLGSLLVRSSGGADDRGPDWVQQRGRQRDLRSVAVLPGTSVAGALRARARRVCAWLGAPRRRTDEIVDALFGPELGSGDAFGGAAPRASRLSVAEQVVQGGRDDLVQVRVAIDRFTGGALASALFNEQPVFADGDTSVRFELRLEDPAAHEFGLLLQLVKDVWSGDLSFGGEAAGGRGRFEGDEATIGWQVGGEVREWRLTARDGRVVVSGDETGFLADCATQLVAAAAHPAAEVTA